MAEMAVFNSPCRLFPHLAAVYGTARTRPADRVMIAYTSVHKPWRHPLASLATGNQAAWSLCRPDSSFAIHTSLSSQWKNQGAKKYGEK